MKPVKFKPTHKVITQYLGEFTFPVGELLQHVYSDYYKDLAGNISHVEDKHLSEL